MDYETIANEVPRVGEEGLSAETIADWFSYFREVCMVSLDERYRNLGPMSGPGSIVEIDEAKIGHRKYNVGQIVEIVV